MVAVHGELRAGHHLGAAGMVEAGQVQTIEIEIIVRDREGRIKHIEKHMEKIKHGEDCK